MSQQTDQSAKNKTGHIQSAGAILQWKCGLNAYTCFFCMICAEDSEYMRVLFLGTLHSSGFRVHARCVPWDFAYLKYEVLFLGTLGNLKGKTNSKANCKHFICTQICLHMVLCLRATHQPVLHLGLGAITWTAISNPCPSG